MIFSGWLSDFASGVKKETGNRWMRFQFQEVSANGKHFSRDVFGDSKHFDDLSEAMLKINAAWKKSGFPFIRVRYEERENEYHSVSVVSIELDDEPPKIEIEED